MSSTLIRKYWRWFATGCVGLVVSFIVGDYILGVHSEEMAVATARLQQSQIVANMIGQPIDIRLRRLFGYAHRGGFGNSEARLSLIAVGPKGTMPIAIRLKQFNGEWQIAGATVPLEMVDDSK